MIKGANESEFWTFYNHSRKNYHLWGVSCLNTATILSCFIVQWQRSNSRSSMDWSADGPSPYFIHLHKSTDQTRCTVRDRSGPRFIACRLEDQVGWVLWWGALCTGLSVAKKIRTHTNILTVEQFSSNWDVVINTERPPCLSGLQQSTKMCTLDRHSVTLPILLHAHK